MINTERLLIRPFRESDAEDAFEWRSDPEVNRFMPYPCDDNVEELRQRIKEWITDNDKYAIVLKATDKVIGDISLEWSEKDGVHEIGYNINRSFWRKGYATEAVKALIQWAFNAPQVIAIEAETESENTASIRVLEKCGFKLNGKIGEEGPRYTIIRY